MSIHDEATEAMELVAAIRPLLAGKDASVQGAVIADLLAAWLAGHVQLGNPKQTKKIREQMLKMHLIHVRALIDINYKMTVEPQIKAKMQ